MKHRWLVRMLLAGLTLVVLPAAARKVNLNLAAIDFYHCDDWIWPWDFDLWFENYIDEKQVGLLQYHLCPSQRSDIVDLEVLLRNLEGNHADPVSHSELSSLYRRIGLEKEAEHELIRARSNSASARWFVFLGCVGLAEQAVAGYANFHHLSQLEACAELQLTAEAVSNGTFEPKLAAACLLLQP